MVYEGSPYAGVPLLCISKYSPELVRHNASRSPLVSRHKKNAYMTYYSNKENIKMTFLVLAVLIQGAIGADMCAAKGSEMGVELDKISKFTVSVDRFIFESHF